MIAAFGGCIGQENRMNTELAEQNNNNSDITQNGKDSNVIQNASKMGNDTEINQISVKVDSKNFNKTGRMNISLKITNPRINETVITLFSTEFMPQWSDESTITIIKNHTWTRNYSVPAKNTSYIKMVVEISENNSVVKMAKWNITGWAPAGG